MLRDNSIIKLWAVSQAASLRQPSKVMTLPVKWHKICTSKWKHLALSSNCLCDLCVITGDHRALPGLPHGGKQPSPLQTQCTASASQFSGVSCTQRLSPTPSTQARVRSFHSSPSASILSPLYWGLWLRHFNSLFHS